MAAARFLTDASLEFLARRLRFLGFDVVVHRGARLEELFEAAGIDGRAVLTKSVRHPRRFASIERLSVVSDDAAAMVRNIAERYETSGAPFSRCPDCNTPLQRRHPMEARGEVPGRVLRAHSALSFCTYCGKWYWAGTHVVRIRAWLEEALGHPLRTPQNDPGGTPARSETDRSEGSGGP